MKYYQGLKAVKALRFMEIKAIVSFQEKLKL